MTATSGIAAPEWIKLVRQGSTFSDYLSKEVSSWTLVGSATMATTVYVGLIVNSHNDSALCTVRVGHVN